LIFINHLLIDIGRYHAAIFRATPDGKKLSRAVHLQGQPVPVTVRHGHSASGNPWGPAVTPSMAVKFYLPDGTVTDLIGLTIPLFFGRTPDEVLEGLKVLKPDPFILLFILILYQLTSFVHLICQLCF
jgi:catalase